MIINDNDNDKIYETILKMSSNKNGIIKLLAKIEHYRKINHYIILLQKTLDKLEVLSVFYLKP